MNVEIKRKQIEIEQNEINSFYQKIEKLGYFRTKYQGITDSSHFEICKYKSKSVQGDKITCVYDTKANIVNIDAQEKTLESLTTTKSANKKNIKQASEKAPVAKKQVASVTNKTNSKKAVAPKAKQPLQKEESVNNTPKAVTPKVKAVKAKTAKPQAKKVEGEQVEQLQSVKPKVRVERKKMISVEQKCIIKTPTLKNAPLIAPPRKSVAHIDVTQEEKPARAQKDSTYNINNFDKAKLGWCLDVIKQRVNVKVKGPTKDKQIDGIRYEISQDKLLVKVSYTNNKQLILSGQTSQLFSELKDIFSTKSDIKLLKSHLPKSLILLGEASRIDLSNGIKDMMSAVVLTDYSVLLTAPCRALEKLIFDLQQAQKINVKMIGQAYEKDDNGNYLLKSGYIRKIDSVIYPEVMTALYTEYFNTRNYFVHSNNSSETVTRGIGNKAEARNILDNLIKVIEYNCKKLLEIGFSTDN